MSIKSISVIGLGAMGTPIATILLKAGYDVTGFDIVKKRMSNLVPLGLKPVKSPKEAAKGADLIMLSLPNWDIVREVVEGKEGILAVAGKGQIIVDTSTVPPWETKAMAQRLAKKGIDWMDGPISGSSAQARVGNMLFMGGGRKSIFNKVKPVLDKVVSHNYGGNYAWFELMMLAYNLMNFFKKEVLNQKKVKNTIQTIIDRLFIIPGRLISTSRRQVLKLEESWIYKTY